MDLIVDYNFHTHTARCGHAVGEDEEYVLKAIEKGIKILGFSDHAPFKDIIHPNMRMNYDKLQDYISSINYLKEKYKDKIEIHCGLEIEFDKKYLSYYKELLNNGIEYLITGQHCYYENNWENFYVNGIDDFKGIKKYCNDIIEGMKTGLFLYVCHIDFKGLSIKDPNIMSYIGKTLGETSIKYNVPIELNCGGLLGNNYHAMLNGTHPYPNHYTFEEVGKLNCKVVIGYDVHNPNGFDVINQRYLNDFIKKHKLNLIKDFKINNG